MNPSKPIYMSRTFWLNILGTAAMLTGYLPEQYGVPAMGVLNIVLRFLTTQPVTVA